MIRFVTAGFAMALWVGSAWAQPAAKPAAAKSASAESAGKVKVKVKGDKKGPKEDAGKADKASGGDFWIKPTANPKEMKTILK